MSIVINNLKYGYSKEHEVLDDISFVAKNKEILVLLGPNGSGKSTLLNCLDMQIKKWTGYILINDKDIRSYKPKELASIISYVTQDIELTGFTVYDTILLHCYPHMVNGPSREDYDSTNKIIEKMNLSSIAHKSIGEISGGERQKVALASALVNEPSILILDEPTANLDLANQLEIINIVKELKEKNDMTIIMSLHDINFASTFGDKFCLLKDGKIVDFGDNSILSEDNIKLVYGVNTRRITIDDKTYIVTL